jgi:ABC-type amino acid transport substrate-binding protein
MNRVTVCLFLCATFVAMPGHGGVLDDLRKNPVLKIAYRPDLPPFSSAQGNEPPAGFAIDLCRSVATRLGTQLKLPSLDVKFVEVTAKNRIDAIKNGQAHIECGTTTVTFSRLEKVDFSSLFYITGTSLMTRAGATLAAVEDLRNRKIAVTEGTTTDRVLTKTLEQKGIAAEIERVANNQAALKLLLDSKVDAMAGDQATLLGLGMSSGRHGELLLTPILLSVEALAFPIPRNDADFRLAVNHALSDIYLSGEVGRTWQKWFGPFGVKPTSLLLELYRLNSFSE